MKKNLVLLTIAFALCFSQGSNAQNLSSTDVPRILSYQGHITNADQVVTGVHPITVRLYSDPEGKHKLWEDTYSADVKDGIFNLLLGTQTALPDSRSLDRPIWLGVSIEGTDELRPLTQFTAAPYALSVPDKSITKEKLSDDLIALMTRPIGEQNKQVAGANALLGGNLFDRAPGVEYIGSDGSTTGSKQVWFKTGGTTALRLSHSTATSGTPNIIGGYSGNVIDSATQGAVIAGGGESGSVNTIITDFGFIGSGKLNTVGHASYLGNVGQAIVAGETNTAIGNLSFIGAGEGNSTFNDAEHSAVVGGHSNEVRKAGSFVGAGYINHAYALYSAIPGGSNNTITGLSDNSAIGGGAYNDIDAYYSTVSGGENNDIGSGGGSMPKWSTIGGGKDNYINTADYYSAIVGGYSNLIKGGGSNVIVGGYDNQINTLTSPNIYPNSYSFIGGGYHNIVDSYDDPNHVSYSTIVGGKDNYTMESRVFIGGGESNFADEDWTVVTGGYDNDVRGYYGFAGGGYKNKVGTFHTDGFSSTISGGNENSLSGGYSFIGGGKSNSITSSLTEYNSIVGGLNNEIVGTKSTISGGDNNTITNSILTINGASIGGGSGGTINSSYSTISGGWNNTIFGHGSTISGGIYNKNFNNTLSVISGGGFNRANGICSFVGGGGSLDYIPTDSSNQALGDYSVVVGGSSNIASGEFSFIGGGGEDPINPSVYPTIPNKASGSHSIVVGGKENQSIQSFSTIVGGETNLVEPAYAIIGAGFENNILDEASPYSGIFSGYRNTIDKAQYSFIGSGSGNSISTTGLGWLSGVVVAGGGSNSAIKNFSTIGGGQNNTVSEQYATIPGGQQLVAGSYAQAVVGNFNKAQGTSTVVNQNAGDRLFIVGNGTATNARSNAFEVSNDGHSIVYHNNTVNTNPAIKGARYIDNTMVAWGHVQGATGALTSGFACAVVFGAPNIYTVTVNYRDPYTNAIVPIINGSSITATLIDNGGSGDPHCGFITVTPIVYNALTGNTFTVRTWKNNADCDPDKRDFMFQVVCRP